MSGVSFEDRIFDAIVDRFFMPEWISVMVWDQSANQNVPTMVQQTSPVARIASDIFKAHETKILEAVKDKVDIDAIAEKVWERIEANVIERLTRSGYLSYGSEQEQKKMRDLINDKVATELARRTIERLDEEAAGQ